MRHLRGGRRAAGFRDQRVGHFVSQDLSILLRNSCGSLAENCLDSRRLSFPCKMTNKHCGDLRRRRIRAKTAQTNVEILAHEIPFWRAEALGGAPRSFFTSGGFRGSLPYAIYVVSDDRIIREIHISGKAAFWLQRDLGCRLLVCSA